MTLRAKCVGLAVDPFDLFPSSQPVGDTDRSVSDQCRKGHPDRQLIGAPELLSTLTDITSFSSGRATTYTWIRMSGAGTKPRGAAA